MRHDAELPIGLHPVLALPDAAGGAQLKLAAREAIAYPVPTEPGVSRLTPGAVTRDLRNLPAQGGPIDVTALPLDVKTEELVQAAVETGAAELFHGPDGYRVTLSWDAKHFPFCLLWISNKGRREPPWSGRHVALGIEPVCAAFDLGVGTSLDGRTPLARLGRTALPLRAGMPFATCYTIGVDEL